MGLQAAWIALTGRYAMAFDEDFHLGVIRLYADHTSPFWSAQPVGGDTFGAVARDPSYLYHYLMSFPYRLISAITTSPPIQVVFLRVINIGLFLSCLPLYRRLLLKTGASKALVQACLAAFVLIPIVPMLAAQINYDNLLLPVTATTLLLAARVSAQIGQKKLDLVSAAQLAIVCLLGSVIKYAFLPIVLGVAILIAIRLVLAFGSWRKLMTGLNKSIALFRPRQQMLLMALLVISAGLFAERYAINTIRFHTPVPDCGQVLTIKQCSAYGPWVRDYNFERNKSDTAVIKSPISYSSDWFYGLWLRSFFAIGGPGTDYQTRGPFIVPAISAIVLASLSAIALLITVRRLLKRPQADVLLLFMGVCASYLVILWVDDYRAYLQTGQPVAINGRYLLPITPVLIGLAAMSLNQLLMRWRALKPVLMMIILACLLCGGGALTYILRSNDAWYWQAQSVYDANHAVQTVLGGVIPGYNYPTQFLR